MTLTRKSFTTRDSNGCEFIAEAFYSFESKYDVHKGKTVKVRNDLYTGMGFEAATLQELKNKVARA